MIILKNKEFAKKESENNKDSRKELNLAKSYGLNLAAGAGTIGNLAIVEKGIKDIRNNSEIAESIKKKLLDDAKKRGVKVVNSNVGNSFYTGNGKIARAQGKAFKGLYKKLRINGVLDPYDLLDEVGKNKILLGPGSLSDVDILSHELGHEHFTNSKTSIKNVIPKLSHKVMPIGKFSSGLPSIVAGYYSGKNSVNKKAEGKEEGSISKNISWALPAAGNIPVLTSEAAASLHGYNNLKKLGADKAIKSIARKRLGNALLTYGVNAGTSILTGLGAREYGKYVAKKENEDKNKKEKKK